MDDGCRECVTEIERYGRKMTMISDEIRELIDDEDLYPGQIAGLRLIADRIDAELVELPKDRDGEPIHVGDTVYACDDPSLEYKASYIEYGRNAVTVGMYATDIQTYRKPSYISHTRPDSFESIADEMDKFVDDTPGIDTFYASTASRLRDFADRIRKLAKEQDDEQASLRDVRVVGCW